MTESNLQKSEFTISKILERLLDFGLLQGMQLCIEDLDLPEGYAPIYNGCCAWLLDEGIIRCANTSKPWSGSIVLISPMITSKGFALLDQPFSVEGKSLRVGEAVKEVAAGRRSYASFGDFIGGVLGGFTKSMGT